MSGTYFDWKPGYGAKVDAKVAHDALEKIRASNNGELTADVVVKASRGKRHPLHKQIFDKPEAEAAQEHYKSNARLMMRMLIVRVPEAKHTPVRALSVIRQEPSGKGGRTTKVYGKTTEALQDPEHRQYILANAMREAAAWRARYAALSELAKVFTVIDEVAAEVL